MKKRFKAGTIAGAAALAVAGMLGSGGALAQDVGFDDSAFDYSYYGYYDGGYDENFGDDWFYDYYEYDFAGGYEDIYGYDYGADVFDWEEDGLFG